MLTEAARSRRDRPAIGTLQQVAVIRRNIKYELLMQVFRYIFITADPESIRRRTKDETRIHWPSFLLFSLVNDGVTTPAVTQFSTTSIRKLYNNNNSNNNNVYDDVITAKPLREFTRFISWMQNSAKRPPTFRPRQSPIRLSHRSVYSQLQCLQ